MDEFLSLFKNDDAVDYFRFLFAYNDCMFRLPEPGLCDFTIVCKGCGESIPAPVETMPDYWIVAQCPLCGEKRRYLPSDIFRGRISLNLIWKPPQRAGLWGK